MHFVGRAMEARTIAVLAQLADDPRFPVRRESRLMRRCARWPG